MLAVYHASLDALHRAEEPDEVRFRVQQYVSFRLPLCSATCSQCICSGALLSAVLLLTSQNLRLKYWRCGWQDDRASQQLVASAVEDALATQDDELDRHMDMLPLVRFIEKAATLAGDAPQPQAGSCGSLSLDHWSIHITLGGCPGS